MNKSYCKKKSVYIDDEEGEDYKVFLKLSVFREEGIDTSQDIPADERLYQVVFWVDPDNEWTTAKVDGRPNPIWNRTYSMELDKHIGDYRFLYLEILRYSLPGTIPDPGTSCGRKMVGRTRICLPPLGKRISGKFELIKIDGQEAEGYISLRLKAEKVSYDDYYCYKY